MSSRKKILLGVAGFYIVSMFFVILIFGATRRDNEEFAPQNEFKTDTWISLPGPFDFNKAVLDLASIVGGKGEGLRAPRAALEPLLADLLA